MMNITGDLIRSTWYFTYSVARLRGHSDSRTTALCQLTGFFLSIGHELTGRSSSGTRKPTTYADHSFLAIDFSVLFITIHGAIQVYLPRVDPLDPRYGLNPIRYYINAFLVIVPLLLASLAFINPQGAYEYNAGVCWLPIQPIWYRLALSWIPRYVIFVTIIVLSFAVYIHIGNQFDAFREMWTISRRESHGSRWRYTFRSGMTTPHTPRSGAHDHLSDAISPHTMPQAHFDFDLSRRSSLSEGNWQDSRTRSQPSKYLVRRHAHEEVPRVALSLSTSSDGVGTTESSTDSEVSSIMSAHAAERTAGDHVEQFRSSNEPPLSLDGVRSDVSHRKVRLPRQNSVVRRVLQGLPRDVADPGSSQMIRSHADDAGFAGDSSPHHMLEAKRATVMLQVRMNFTYPIVYVALWVIPFVLHCMQYKAIYARDPPTALAALSNLCISGMGFANCLVFLLREQPWRIVGTLPEWLHLSWLCGRSTKRHSSSSSGSKRFDLPLGTDSSGRRMELGTISRRSSTALTGPDGYFQNIKWPSSRWRQTEDDPRKMKNLNFSARTSAKASARLRLALERADRRAEIKTDVADDSSYIVSYNLTSTIGKDGVGRPKNWWDHGFVVEGLPFEDSDHDLAYP